MRSSADRVAASSRVSASASAGGRPVVSRPGGGREEAGGERVAGLDQPLVQVGVHKGAGPAGRPVDRLGGQLGLARRADPVGQLVRLVDDEQPVRSG